MIAKLQELKDRFEEVGQLMVQPDAMADMKKYSQLSKEYSDLEKVVKVYDVYLEVLSNINGAKEVLNNEKDEEFREMAKMELDDLEPKQQKIEEQLKELLIPKDPNDDKEAILEIRAGTGGDKASIFAGDLFRMYKSYSEDHKWSFSVLNFNRLVPSANPIG